MTSKTTIGLAAVGLALVALAPLAGASTTDDTLSRMFPYISTVRGEVQNGGIGWFDTDSPPNICLFTLMGAQGAVLGDVYYDTARVHFNFEGYTAPTTVGVSQFVPAPCPAVLEPLCTAATNCGIYVEQILVEEAVRTFIPQTGSVCIQQSSFIDCVVTGSSWEAATCAWGNAEFTGRIDPNKGFLGGTGLHTLALSEDVNCNGAGYSASSDFSSLLGTSGDLLSSGFEGFSAESLVANGSGSAYIVSCLEATYTTVDSSNPIPVITSGIVNDGVDWVLILDLAEAGAAWTGPLTAHLGAGANGQLAAGLYDLGGDNDCDF